MSEDTDIIKAKNPLLWALLSFMFRELRVLVYAGVAYYMAHSSEHKDVQWLGQHLSQKQAEIQQIEKEKP